MTISEFIEHLKTLPPEAEMVVYNGSDQNPCFNRVTGTYDLNDPGSTYRPVFVIDDGGSDSAVWLDDVGHCDPDAK